MTNGGKLIMEMLMVVGTSMLSIIALFLISKVLGHKQISQLDLFDYINGIVIGSIAAELATELEEPLRPLTAMFVYGTVTVLLSLITRKFPKTRKYINGSPTIIMNNGKIYRSNMKKAKLDLSEFMVMCRQAGYFNLNDIQTAIFEYNGKLTVLPVSDKRPVNPTDIDLKTKPEYMSTEVIMDGRVLGENLKRRGLDMTWLKKQLEKQGFHNAKEVFLGVCDSSNNLSLFKAN